MHSDFGELLAAKDDLGGCSDCIRALAPYGGGSNVIEYLTIATGGNAFAFGDSKFIRLYMSGFLMVMEVYNV